MAHKSEIDRIDDQDGLETLPAASWGFELDLGNDSVAVMARIRSVVREVAVQQDGLWPDDDYWKSELPGWLVSFMPDLTQEECNRLMAATPREKWNTLPWQFGSWVDAMRERGWKWWGYESSGPVTKLVLQITSVPGRVEAFKQILLAAGAVILKESY